MTVCKTDAQNTVEYIARCLCFLNNRQGNHIDWFRWNFWQVWFMVFFKHIQHLNIQWEGLASPPPNLILYGIILKRWLNLGSRKREGMNCICTKKLQFFKNCYFHMQGGKQQLITVLPFVKTWLWSFEKENTWKELFESLCQCHKMSGEKKNRWATLA